MGSTFISSGSLTICGGNLNISNGNLNISNGNVFVYGNISTANLQVQTNLSSGTVMSNKLIANDCTLGSTRISNYLSMDSAIYMRWWGLYLRDNLSPNDIIVFNGSDGIDIGGTSKQTFKIGGNSRMMLNSTSLNLSNTSLNISSGNLNISSGNLAILNGGLINNGTSTMGSTFISSGSLTICGGNLNISSGNLNISSGNITILNGGILGQNVGNNTISLNTNYTTNYPVGDSTLGTVFNSTTSNIFIKEFTTLTDGNYKMKTNLVCKFNFYYKFVFDTV